MRLIDNSEYIPGRLSYNYKAEMSGGTGFAGVYRAGREATCTLARFAPLGATGATHTARAVQAVAEIL